jgi:hypothetical protein
VEVTLQSCTMLNMFCLGSFLKIEDCGGVVLCLDNYGILLKVGLTDQWCRSEKSHVHLRLQSSGM